MIFILVLLLFSCSEKVEYFQSHIQGRTMGTTYNIKIVSESPISKKEEKMLKVNVDSILNEVNNQMSTWRKDSEISRFNRHESLETFSISKDFYSVLERSQAISKSSEGHFDTTVKTLVSAWGFKQKERPKKKLSQSYVDSLLNFVGYEKLELLGNGKIRKTHPKLSLDLGGIAKGFGVDKIMFFLDSKLFKNYFIEIGGEDFMKGHNQNGKAWRVGINMPNPNLKRSDLFEAILSVSNKAIATSGDYRNFYWLNGEFVSHRINPKTGYPVYSKLASATVIADNCTDADALATAFLVAGTKKSLELVKKLDNVDLYLIERENDSSFVEYFSDGFKENYLK